MREQLSQYIELLFAGAQNAEDIKQEILSNTQERYDDLVAQGKTPQAAYQLAIVGIGDINEILGNVSSETVVPPVSIEPREDNTPSEKPFWKKLLEAISVFLYIISFIPLLVLSELGMETIGLCGTLSIVAVATVLLILSNGRKNGRQKKQSTARQTESELEKAINSIIFAVGLCCYFAISFATGAWYITWLIFPIMAAARGLVKACMDLRKEK